MGTTLDNGIYLPDEGERNCYEGLAGNWVALDNHLGSTNIHVTINDKQAWNGHVADTTIHVTSADKQTWNSHVADTTIHVASADKQAWDGHVADTTIHVTSADKQAWDGHVADSVKHVTAEDKAKWDAVTSKANDSDVVHNSGNETVGGAKTFSTDLTVANTDTTANTPNLNLRNYKADRGTTDTAVQTIGFLDKKAKALTILESRRLSNGNTNTNILCYNTDDSNNTVSGGVAIIKSKTSTNFAPNADNAVTCGRSLAKWSDVVTYKVNGVEPSSLSLPSGNFNDVIDISSYLVNLDGTTNTYTAPANGWISISMTNCSSIQAYITGLWGHQVIRPSAGVVRFFMPILKNQTASIWIWGGNIDKARFIPCQGNV